MDAIHSEVLSPTAAAAGPALELKGTIAPVTVLCLRSTDIERIEAELRARVEPAPQLFLNAPVVIDVGYVDAEGDPVPLAAVAELVRRCKLVPVGVAHLVAENVALAVEAGLAIVQIGVGRGRGNRSAASTRPQPAPAPEPEPVAKPPAAESLSTVTVRTPVRGGQVVYAQKADLVVIGPVNPGAQVIADGHVHVYGPLRGRALAGAHGNPEARVFCHSLEAELVSVAGEFLTADEIAPALRGRPSQVFMENGVVRVAAI